MKKLAAFFLAFMIAFSFAETTTYATPITINKDAVEDDVDDMEWGWLGLLGLFGLMGLKRKDDHRDRHVK